MSKMQEISKAFKASMIAVPLVMAASNVDAQSKNVRVALTDGKGQSHTQSANCRDFMEVSGALYMTNTMASQLDIKMGARVSLNSKENNLKNIKTLEDLKAMSERAHDYVQEKLGEYPEETKVLYGQVLIANAIEAGLGKHIKNNHNVSNAEFDRYMEQTRAKCNQVLGL